MVLLKRRYVRKHRAAYAQARKNLIHLANTYEANNPDKTEVAQLLRGIAWVEPDEADEYTSWIPQNMGVYFQIPKSENAEGRKFRYRCELPQVVSAWRIVTKEFEAIYGYKIPGDVKKEVVKIFRTLPSK